MSVKKAAHEVSETPIDQTEEKIYEERQGLETIDLVAFFLIASVTYIFAKKADAGGAIWYVAAILCLILLAVVGAFIIRKMFEPKSRKISGCTSSESSDHWQLGKKNSFSFEVVFDRIKTLIQIKERK